jgi:hypothetical protein
MLGLNYEEFLKYFEKWDPSVRIYAPLVASSFQSTEPQWQNLQFRRMSYYHVHGPSRVGLMGDTPSRVSILNPTYITH